jgi:hypothetical protein
MLQIKEWKPSLLNRLKSEWFDRREEKERPT